MASTKTKQNNKTPPIYNIIGLDSNPKFGSVLLHICFHYSISFVLLMACLHKLTVFFLLCIDITVKYLYIYFKNSDTYLS